VETYFHRDGEVSAFVEGGMGQVTALMATAAAESGVEIRTSANVDRILIDDHSVRGVALEDGQEFRATTVISNADPKRLAREHLTGIPGAGRYVAAVQSLRAEAACLKFHAVINAPLNLSQYFRDQPIPRIGHVALGPTLDRFKRARDNVAAGVHVEDPIVYLHLPSVFDKTLTESPLHCVSAYVRYAPVRLKDGTWSEQKAHVARALIDGINEFLPTFRRSLVDWVLFTPADLEERIGLTNGNIHHLDHVPGQYLGERQVLQMGYSTPIDGLYLCGAGMHPGGEVSGAPGHNAAMAVLRERRTM
jgi:phytoene dehydrogenase-like protein